MEEANIFLTENHQDDDKTSHFSYQNLFLICKKITKETCKLEQTISTSKDSISSFELKNKNLLEEIKSLKERQYDLIQNFFSYYKVLGESIECDQCNILKNKIDDIKNTLDKFIKWINNLNLC